MTLPALHLAKLKEAIGIVWLELIEALEHRKSIPPAPGGHQGIAETAESRDVIRIRITSRLSAVSAMPWWPPGAGGMLFLCSSASISSSQTMPIASFSLARWRAGRVIAAKR